MNDTTMISGNVPWQTVLQVYNGGGWRKADATRSLICFDAEFESVFSQTPFSATQNGHTRFNAYRQQPTNSSDDHSRTLVLPLTEDVLGKR